MAFEIKRGDTRPIYIAQLKDKVGTSEEGPLNLTEEEVTAVRFKMRKSGQAGAPLVDEPATIDDAVNGVVSYEWQAGDTDITGSYEIEFELTFADGGKESVPSKGFFSCTINPDLDV